MEKKLHKTFRFKSLASNINRQIFSFFARDFNFGTNRDYGAALEPCSKNERL